MIKADLHIHNESSDGSKLSAENIIKMALEKNVKIIAFTNYDIVTEIRESFNDIKIISAGEFYCKNHDEIKILAYDFKNHYEVFNKYSTSIKKARLNFFYTCFKTLDANEIKLLKSDFNKFINSTKNSKVIDSFTAYRETYWDTSQLISQIHACGGLAVLSCPSYICNINEQTKEIVNYFISQGIDGVECYHPKIMPQLRDKLIKICISHNLLISGGSNFSKFNCEIAKINDLDLNTDLLTICSKFR